MAFWNRRRSIDVMMAPHDGPRLKPTLSWPHLLALGVGAIVGTGILTLIGVGAGLLVGAGRVLQGGHFLSDIVFAGLAMHGVCLLIRAGWVGWRWRRRQRAFMHATGAWQRASS